MLSQFLCLVPLYNKTTLIKRSLVVHEFTYGYYLGHEDLEVIDKQIHCLMIFIQFFIHTVKPQILMFTDLALSSSSVSITPVSLTTYSCPSDITANFCPS